VRYSALALELGGLFVVAAGIASTRRQFEKPGLKQAVVSWFNDLANAWKAPRNISLTLEPVRLNVRVNSPTITITPQLDLEERVALAERQLVELRADLDTIRRDVESKATEQANAVRKEAAGREVADEKLRKMLEDVAAGGLTLETIGLTWLLLGTVAGFLSEELGPYAAAVGSCS
jgi:hypothetical protein